MEIFVPAVVMKLLMIMHILTCQYAFSSSSSTTNGTNNDLLALLAFKSQIELPPNSSVLSSWNTNTSFCHWVGVSCSLRHQRVTALNLYFMELEGTISPHIGNLSFLRHLDLNNNSFHGPVPETIGRLRRLRLIDLGENQLEGTIPSSISQCHMLQTMYLGPNYFHGNIPKGIGKLTNLEILDLQFNNLTGTISSSVFNLSSLRLLALSSNRISGSIPIDMCYKLPKLEAFYLSDNPIGGHVPASCLCLCRNLKQLGLGKNGFVGSIPRCLGNLSELESLSFQENNLSGEIPSELGQLSNLRILNLKSNNLSGRLPPTIFNLNSSSSAEIIHLSENLLRGHVPKGLCHCKNLKELALNGNGFVGSIPRCLGNLSHLELLDLRKNNMSGEVPLELGQLPNLRTLALNYNNLSGRLPPTIFNLSSSEKISLAFNNLSGNVLEFTGFRLPKLQELYLNRNRFSGRIPDSISNASVLTILELAYNFFDGPVPMMLGGLRYLKVLNMQGNELTNDPSQRELHFLTSLTQCFRLRTLAIGYNPLNGALPESIGNFSTSLETFFAIDSQIQGSLPHQISNLSGLLYLNLQMNDLIGAFPSSMGNLLKLQQLYLYGNKIEGNLPNEVCRLTSLGDLDLSLNKLFGPIPPCIGNLTTITQITFSSNAFTSIPHSIWSLSNLWFMNFSVNFFTGYLPPEIGKLVNLQILDLSMNQLSASIPQVISNLKMLEQLNLSENAFQGNIPTSIGDLGSLKSLDLSSNNLSGIVPKSLEKLYYLNYLNLSFNMLSGPVPSNGAFANFTIQSFMGNHDLCGNSKLKLPPCPHASPSKSRKAMFWLKYVLPPIFASILVALLLILYIKYWRKSNKLPVSSIDLSMKLGHKYISYYDLLNATNNLNEENLLGSGSFGSVYKGTMSDGDIVAIKVFDLEVEGAVSSFDRECQVLKNVRHRNLVKIISSCSNLDFRALVLQYMPNGSLEKWLYSQGQNCLEILQRIDIMIDVALGLEYLHHGYSEPIVHCDLKPSNVLLDENMVAHLGDFGIAKILAKYKSMTQTATLGTLGYIAPEFGLQGRVSPKGDIYSYGIMLMETFTRKNPRDEMFVGGLSLRKWIISSYPDRIMEIMDAGLWAGQENATMTSMDSLSQCLSPIIELALQCSNDLPEERPNMTDIVVKLKKMKHNMMQRPRRFNRE